MSIRVLMLFLCFFSFSCTSYKKPICDSSNTQDIPNLEGFYKIDIPTSSHSSDSHIIAISRISKGLYDIGSEQLETARTCEVDGIQYLESNHSQTLIPRLSIYRIERSIDGSFDLVFMNADINILDQQQIPYQLIEVENNNYYSQKDLREKAKILLIQNQNLSTTQMLQVLDPMSLKITLKPYSE